jgi:hypothetical protein
MTSLFTWRFDYQPDEGREWKSYVLQVEASTAIEARYRALEILRNSRAGLTVSQLQTSRKVTVNNGQVDAREFLKGTDVMCLGSIHPRHGDQRVIFQVLEGPEAGETLERPMPAGSRRFTPGLVYQLGDLLDAPGDHEPPPSRRSRS